MTPERLKWWDSLPTEEKQVRQRIKFCKKGIKWHKENLNDGFAFIVEEAKAAVNLHNQIIKYLRKQITMRPRVKHEDGEDYRECPRCGMLLWRISEDIYFDDPPKYCNDCGQKLRWD